MTDTIKKKSKRGLAALKKSNPARMREICSMGGKAVPGDKRSFAKDRDLAVSAGRKGGQANRGSTCTPLPQII